MRRSLSLYVVAGFVLFGGQSLRAQPTGLVIGHDFEAGGAGGMAADVSTWLPNVPVPLVGDAAVVPSGDPARGMVLSASSTGEHGELSPHPAKLVSSSDDRVLSQWQTWFYEETFCKQHQT